MSAELSRFDPRDLIGRDDVLEQLTLAHADLMERHGPLLGMDGVTPPLGARSFAAAQAELATRQDASPDTEARLNIMLERQAREHEQIGRLAAFIAGYELAHGDPGHAPAMMELGGGHFDLAAECRATLAGNGGLPIEQSHDDFDDLEPIELAPANQNQQPTARERAEAAWQGGEPSIPQYALDHIETTRDPHTPTTGRDI